MNYNEVLQMINYRMGQPPRKFDFLDKLTWLKLDKPNWDWRNEDIKTSIINWDKVFIHGKLTWGHIIQVNTLMFEKSNSNCPGEVLIWLEQSKPFDPDLLELVASKLYELKGYSEYLEDFEEKEFAEYLENELIRAYGIKVPHSVSGNLNLRVSTVFFQRKHIPDKVITSSLFPVLYLETFPMATVMVPFKFWPAEFLNDWKY